MSGMFHTSWGEFGGFKHPDAIRYEAASMVAYGGMCCFGDQLHPSGEMDFSTYANLGEAYEYVQRIESYGIGAQPIANLGVFFSQRPIGGVQKHFLMQRVFRSTGTPSTFFCRRKQARGRDAHATMHRLIAT